ncbi:MAG TPA: universal stress protein [Pirellulales bacterium]|nr:universal stress protein [Pirellulales bacterium]
MPWLPKKCVIVPIDFSDEAFGALDTALDMVDSTSALHALYVLPVLDPAEPGVIWTTIDNSVRERHALDAMREKLADKKYAGVQMKVVFGDPGTEIAAFAKDERADLIVLPSHGRTGLRHLLIGSVAEKVIRLAHCPVLVLRW